MKQLNWYQIFGKSNIPDGRTVLPTDDIQIWLHCANIWDKSYTTLAEVLADTDTLLALITSNNAVDYMVRSTTWAVAQALVPKMTSNTTPEGECIAVSSEGGAYPYYAFDDTSNRWSPYATYSRADYVSWVGYVFTSQVNVHKAVVTFYSKSNTSVMKWKIQGSNDGSNWTDVSSPQSTQFATETTFTVSADIAGSDYQYYRLIADTLYYGGQYYSAVVELQFYSASITSDSTAMTYIGQNNYCANTLLADATWCNAICNSTYFESVLNAKVPTMTSNTAPEGIASQSEYSENTHLAWRVFDNNSSTSWNTNANPSNAWVQYEFMAKVKIYKMSVTSIYATKRRLKTFSLLASDDDFVTYDTLIPLTTLPDDNVVLFEYVCNPNTERKTYRLANVTSYTGNAQIYTLQFYGRKDV